MLAPWTYKGSWRESVFFNTSCYENCNRTMVNSLENRISKQSSNSSWDSVHFIEISSERNPSLLGNTQFTNVTAKAAVRIHDCWHHKETRHITREIQKENDIELHKLCNLKEAIFHAFFINHRAEIFLAISKYYTTLNWSWLCEKYSWNRHVNL